jgi:predicted Zn-dependent protease
MPLPGGAGATGARSCWPARQPALNTSTTGCSCWAACWRSPPGSTLRYQRVRAIDPQSARLSQALGGEYLAQGQPQRARVAFEAAAARDPRLAEVHLALAQLAADDGRWDDAAREVALELAVQPTSREALALRARIDAARSAGRP